MVESLNVAAIVEGLGEFAAVPILIRRICSELLGYDQVHVLRPIRQHRDRLLRNKDDCLCNSLNLAAAKLRQIERPATRNLTLVIVDADQECPAQCGPALLSASRQCRADQDIAVVLPTWEYETWFVAAAESLTHYFNFALTELPTNPEASGASKGWVQRHWRGTKYSESIDQPRLTAMMDLALCRSRSGSFDKLCRELQSRVQVGPT